MTGPYLLAVDNGSQSTKITVVDRHGRVHAAAQHALLPYDTSVPGRAVHPGDDLWDSVQAACLDALAGFPGDRREIVAVGLCAIRFCRALLDGQGELVEPVLSWMDERVGRPHDPTDPRAAHVTTSSGYLTHRLTGRWVDTAANHQGVWPLDRRTARWSDDPAAYAATGMRRELLCDLVAPGGLLGRVTPAAAQATGIPAGVPVYATANDKAVEALGSGLGAGGPGGSSDSGDDIVLLSLGTYIAAMTTGTCSDAADDSYWVNAASMPGRYLYESGGIRRGMWTVSWFRRLVGADGHDRLDAEAAAVPPGCGGLMTVPDWLAPAGAPHRRGAMLGFDGSQERGHVYRSILEGIALTMAGHLAAMERGLGRRFGSVVVSGGGSRSDLMMQILADVLGRPTRRTEAPDAAGLGAAICAAVGSGVHPDWETAVAAMVHERDAFAPDPGRVQAYARIADRYARLAGFTDPLFAALAE